MAGKQDTNNLIKEATSIMFKLSFVCLYFVFFFKLRNQ